MKQRCLLSQEIVKVLKMARESSAPVGVVLGCSITGKD